MRKFLRKFNLFKNDVYYSNEEASQIIYSFVRLECDEYQWGDFELANHSNYSVKLALSLCWYYARKYPSNVKSKYCEDQADEYFLAISNLLKKNYFDDLNHQNLIADIDNGKISSYISAKIEEEKQIIENKNEH